MEKKEIRVIPVVGLPIIKSNDNLALHILEAAKNQNLEITEDDIIVITQRIVSRSEGRIRHLDEFIPSPFALQYAENHQKDPRVVEAVLMESKRVIRQVGGVLITETHHGFKCANAGVDASNVGNSEMISLLPINPDKSCTIIRENFLKLNGSNVAVIMTDTFGRPWRHGQTNVAIGVAGMLPFRDYVGEVDMDGRELAVTTICVADELAGMAELVMGKSDGIPVAVIKGYPFPKGNGSSKEIVRETALDLFP